MKRASAICLVMILLCTLLAGTVLAEETTWHCETCDADRDTAFCPTCGAKRPEAEPEPEPEAEPETEVEEVAEPGPWICPTCGKEVAADYGFCPDDGTKKSPWPHRELTGTAVKLKKYVGNSPLVARTGLKRQAYLGPDKNKYPGAGSYKPEVTPVCSAYFREGEYVYVDIPNPGKKGKCVYFMDYSLVEVPETVEDVTLEGIPAKMVREETAILGPGTEYEELDITETAKAKGYYWHGGYYVQAAPGQWMYIEGAADTYVVVLQPDTELVVFFEYKNWVFTEFETAVGPVRAWFPAEAVEPIEQ